MEAETVALLITIVGSGLGSSLATIRILLHQMNQLEVRLTDQIKENRAEIKENRAQINENRVEIHKNGVQITKNGAQITKNRSQLEEHCRRLGEMSGQLSDQQGGLRDVRESLARVEGFLMAPEGFRPRGPLPVAVDEPITGDSAPRTAGGRLSAPTSAGAAGAAGILSVEAYEDAHRVHG